MNNTEGEFVHRPVLLEEALVALDLKPDGMYVDATFGRGGHAAAILQRLGPQGRLLAIDKDPDAIAAARERFADEPRFSIFHGSFAELGAAVDAAGVRGQVDGLLLDLGVSSPQLDDASRGFSFMRDGPLDMRMDISRGLSAAQWLAQAGEGEIARVLKELGEERFAKRIARAIVTTRQENPIETTRQLAKLVTEAIPRWEPDKNPATRSFQAIRIFINRELDDIRDCMDQVVEVLAVGGRLAVISFHSLEDRIVKRFMRDEARGDDFPVGLPVTVDQLQPTLRVVGKAVRASAEEVDVNPRARSAVLRIAEKM
ncbi:MAG: 16S rRNA (cytosine(1402)-N(4))-methyltransferase RsmH [Pseudomonadota bacterium]|nr:16S rRNA (cytosine(1402)-N(4))-methyltransferase RsmH [Pseudomonadota bacterium]